MNPPPLYDTLKSILVSAGAEALAVWEAPEIELKEDGSPVTLADKRSQASLIKAIEKAFPEDGYEAEEGAQKASQNGAWWAIDPLDGTSAYTEKLAHWGPTICRIEDGELTVGAFYQPLLNRFLFAQRGEGAWADGRRLPHLTDLEAPEKGTIGLPSRAHQVGPFPWKGRSRALGSTAAHLSFVATGGSVAAVIPTWKLWDIGAGVLMLQEVGGTIVDLSGQGFDPIHSRGLPFIGAHPQAVAPLVRSIHSLLSSMPRNHSNG